MTGVQKKAGQERAGQERAGKYQPPAGVEAEAEPGSRGRVLRNKLGIKRKRDMDRAEYEAFLQVQESALEWVTPQTRFTARLLCRIHQDWLGNIYEWAGRYRTVDVSKGGFTWPPAVLVPQNMQAFENGLLRQHMPCPPAPPPEVAGRLAKVHAELLLIHPFREGNGRLARLLADLMALQAGLAAPKYPFEGRGNQAERAKYLWAVSEGYLMRYEPLTRFFVEALARRGRVES